ncbi:MAG: ABC transporter permease [Deltaproteobacteria bacterium]|nr:ABC transporter permease [Deltaproteobacteria bacterium]
MAWRNIWRNTRRSILTISAIVFATVLLIFMLSWQFGSYETMINTAVKVHTGHVQVQARGYREQMEIPLVVSDPAVVKAALGRTEGVAAYSFRANAFSLISSKDRTYGALVIGIDPEGEMKVSTLKQLVRTGEYLSPGDNGQVLVGRLLAKNLRVDVGDELVLLGQGRDGSIAATVVLVKGIFSSGEDEFDRGSLHMPLAYFQEVYGMRGAVHEVVILGKALDDTAGIKLSLEKSLHGQGDNGDLAVLDWKEMMPGLVEAIKMDLLSGLIMYVVLIVVVAFSILNTFLMAIFERTKEFGVLMAIGTRPGRLTRLLLLESTGLTTIGIIVGVVAGALLTWHFQVRGIIIPDAGEWLRQFGLPERMYPQLSFLSISIGSGIVFIITVLTALYPAFRVRLLKPVEAMKAV